MSVRQHPPEKDPKKNLSFQQLHKLLQTAMCVFKIGCLSSAGCSSIRLHVCVSVTVCRERRNKRMHLTEIHCRSKRVSYIIIHKCLRLQLQPLNIREWSLLCPALSLLHPPRHTVDPFTMQFTSPAMPACPNCKTNLLNHKTPNCPDWMTPLFYTSFLWDKKWKRQDSSVRTDHDAAKYLILTKISNLVFWRSRYFSRFEIVSMNLCSKPSNFVLK